MLDVSTGGYDDELGWVGSDQNQPSSWVATVDGHRSWVGRDRDLDDDIDERTEGWKRPPGGSR